MGVTAAGFHWFDYVIFTAVLVISCGIGLFYALSGGRQRTQQEFLMANRQMKTIPVATSILASFNSAILILGAPAEIYMYGAQYWMLSFGIALACVISSTVFVPLLYPLKLTSSYEYLELRFQSKAAKIVGSIMLITSQVIYMGIATYSPSTALELVTGFPAWASILCVGCVSTFYTAIGGMKAVIWTDVFQSIIMLGGVLAIVIVGCIEVGGADVMWKINQSGGRNNFFDFDPDPTIRQSFWSLVIGGGIAWTSLLGVGQASVQRFCSLPSQNKAKLALLLNAPGILILMTLCCLSGMVIYAYFHDCDPLSHPDMDVRLGNSNQLIPYFVMQVLGWPGVPGVFVATLFSGALSTMSSGLNAMAAVIWEDMLKWKFNNISELNKTIVTKVLVMVIGLCAVFIAFLTQNLGGTVLQASMSFATSASSPLLGLFLLGGIFPWANWLGAVIGGILGLIFPMWISIGQYSQKLYFPKLNLTTAGCNFTVDSTLQPINEEPKLEQFEGMQRLYTISFLWFPLIGVITTVTVGLLISLISSPFLKSPKASEIDRRYLIPLFDWLFCCLPNKCRKQCRCGHDSEKRQATNYKEKNDVLAVKSDQKQTNLHYNDEKGQPLLYSQEIANGHEEKTTL